MGDFFKDLKIISALIKEKLKIDGFNLVQNNFPAAGQVISHFHFHIIPRFNEDFTFKPRVKNYGTGALKEYADKIRSVISKYKDIYNGK